MKQLIVSPRTETVQFGDDSIGFGEFVKVVEGVLQSTDGTVISDLISRLSVVDSKLALDGVQVDTTADISTLQTQINDLTTALTNKVNIFRQSTPPTSGVVVGDFWEDTTNNVLSVYQNVDGQFIWMEV